MLNGPNGCSVTVRALCPHNRTIDLGSYINMYSNKAPCSLMVASKYLECVLNDSFYERRGGVRGGGFVSLQVVFVA